ncbi:unnamed protein product [Macrosiphum euphorbiae]|uniref:Uncharacterized protein n=1 Tax=Macrosiphum euphorbiae TaxID=13131 RepID=A0AAV0WW86_9HEMI|nr:unnamed protein product [Macrosiphum euphorbiae]
MNKSIMEAESNEDKMAEVYNAITGDFLTENPELGFNSALGPGKISTSLYKGLTAAMKQAIYDEQASQRAELKVFHLRTIKNKLKLLMSNDQNSLLLIL